MPHITAVCRIVLCRMAPRCIVLWRPALWRIAPAHVLGLALLAALTGPPARAQSPVPQSPANQSAGLYMERASDCMACHTQPGGTPFAGGRQIGTPFGTLPSPNITPDRDTGIGAWTDDQFYAALHDGIGHNGEYLYPVMPYTSYTRMTRGDVLAIKDYLFTLKPVYAPRAPSGLYFPFDIRASLLVWRELYFTPGTYQDKPAHTALWNRGAYLVQGPGHCGECHSPRTILGGTETQDSLSGGLVQNWLAPNISSDPLAGLGGKSVSDIVKFLHTGADRGISVAFGPMAEVVHDSLRYLTQDDLQAIATYLKEGPDRPAPPPGQLASAASIKAGQALYLQNCAMCHQDKGVGIPGVIPNLAGNAAITASQPNDIINAVLNGLRGTGFYGLMPNFSGALTDQNIADIANYIRTSWVNKAPANATPALVASLRAGANTGAAGTEAARDFDCPKVGSASVAGALATGAEANLLSSPGDAVNHIDELITDIRKQQPGVSDATLTDALNAAYCPVVANNAALSNADKRARLARFNQMLQDQIAATEQPADTRVMVATPLTEAQLQQVAAAAAQAHMTTSQWLASVAAKSAAAAK